MEFDMSDSVVPPRSVKLPDCQGVSDTAGSGFALRELTYAAAYLIVRYPEFARNIHIRSVDLSSMEIVLVEGYSIEAVIGELLYVMFEQGKMSVFYDAAKLCMRWARQEGKWRVENEHL